MRGRGKDEEHPVKAQVKISSKEPTRRQLFIVLIPVSQYTHSQKIGKCLEIPLKRVLTALLQALTPHL